MLNHEVRMTASLPSRECGLKLLIACWLLARLIFAPFAGVWIETVIPTNSTVIIYLRSLRGSVD